MNTEQIAKDFMVRILENPNDIKLKMEILALRVDAKADLDKKREQYRTPPHDPKDKDEPRLTDFDRQVMLNAQVAELNRNYEFYLGLEKILSEAQR